MSADPQPERPNQNRRRILDKGETCQEWTKGNCRLGNGCKYRHGEEERGVKVRSFIQKVPLTELQFKRNIQRDKKGPQSTTNL
jgi:hypothetical protein